MTNAQKGSEFILEQFNKITRPNFDEYDPSYISTIQDHWETFQEGFEAAVLACANAMIKEADN